MIKMASILLNTVVLVSMGVIGAYHIPDAQAESILANVSQEDRHCLRQNIFFEARNQSTLGQVSVAWVTLNRVASSAYPDTICAVVKQGRKDASGNMIRNQCQFSWYCDGKSDRIPTNVIAQRAWEDVGIVADVVLIEWARGLNGPVGDATMYHADYVDPYWTNSFERVTQIDTHVFYE